MPWHGKSNPPEGYELKDYKLTTNLYKEIIMSFCKQYKLIDPVIMGCSMGGRVVLHLALEHCDYFKAVIALEGSDKLEPYYDLEWLHRPDVHGGLVQAAFVSSQIAPKSPNNFKHETLWHYMQGGPGVFKGDLYFYWHDGDFDDRSNLIDTSKCPVYLLSGEYDCSCTPERTMETAKRIKGSKATIIPGIGHFPMSENPDLFKTYIYPILDEIIKYLIRPFLYSHKHLQLDQKYFSQEDYTRNELALLNLGELQIYSMRHQIKFRLSLLRKILF